MTPYVKICKENGSWWAFLYKDEGQDYWDKCRCAFTKWGARREGKKILRNYLDELNSQAEDLYEKITEDDL